MFGTQTHPYPLRPLWGMLRRFFKFTSVDRWWVLLTGMLVIATTIGNTIMIWLLGKPFNLLQQGDFDAIARILLWFVLLILVNFVLSASMTILSAWIGMRYIGRLRNTLFTRILTLSYPVAGRYSKGDLLARLSNDVSQAQELAIGMPLQIVSNLFTAVFYVAMLFWIDTRLALLALAFTPLLLIPQYFFAPRKRRISQQFYNQNGKILALEEDSLGNLRGVSSFNAENIVSRMQQRVFDKFLLWGMRDRWLSVFFSSSFSLLIYLPAVVVVFMGIKDIQSGAIAIGQLVSFMLYLGYLSVPVRGLAQIPFQSQGAVAACDRLVELLEIPPQVRERTAANPLRVNRGVIGITNLHFAYPDGTAVFTGINLTIEAGETVALVGPSGSGKSTLVRLLMRFYDPNTGGIRIDGQELRDVSLASLRQNISVVWQDPFLINDTLRANLHLVRPDAPEDELISACQASHSWDFIVSLEKGLDTIIGAGGIDLSTGQRQRLALAQAFLHAAPILILDEASSALDSQTEALLVQSVGRIRRGRTTLIIAHRLAAIRAADRIIYFNGDGSITIGDHMQLLEQHPGYRQAVRWQTTIAG